MSLLLSSAFNSGEKFYLLASFMGVATATIFNFIGSKVFAFAR
jgi:putative flippase GtrA